MIYHVFASGSTGNCSVISNDDTSILIDAGISRKRIKDSLSNVGIDNISGILITHEHSDHVLGLKMLCKYDKYPVFTTEIIAEAIISTCPEVEPYIHVIEKGSEFCVGSMEVKAFNTPHDSKDSVGYRITSDSVFALSTDMGHITDEVINGLKGADVALIEANYDYSMLINGPYPYVLKRRILSDNGHLPNEESAKLAKLLLETGTKQIVFGHLSRQNNLPSKVKAAFCEVQSEWLDKISIAPETGLLTVEVE